jgi:hypothetical protein
MVGTMSHPLPSHADIAARAYAIWEKCGRPQGCEAEHWARAERELYHDARQAAALHGENLTEEFSSDGRREIPADAGRR